PCRPRAALRRTSRPPARGRGQRRHVLRAGVLLLPPERADPLPRGLRLLPRAVRPRAVGAVRAAERPRPMTAVGARTVHVPERDEAHLLLTAAVPGQRTEGLDPLRVERVVDRRGRWPTADVLTRPSGGNGGEESPAGRRSVVCVHVCANDGAFEE